MEKDTQRLIDNWIYIHDSGIKVARIQNFKSWSEEMVPDPSLACYGLEYFCSQGDALWAARDEDLIRHATQELEKLGIARAQDVRDGCVVRQPKAYPLYDRDYALHVSTIRQEIEAKYPSLHFVGRNGMHKYNNQDHAMMTAMLTVENILAGRPIFDPWVVNQDAEYHEESKEKPPISSGGGLRLVPTPV